MLVVAAALIDPQQRVLLAQRPEGRAMAGLWVFPGGKVRSTPPPPHTHTHTHSRGQAVGRSPEK